MDGTGEKPATALRESQRDVILGAVRGLRAQLDSVGSPHGVIPQTIFAT